MPKSIHRIYVIYLLLLTGCKTFFKYDFSVFYDSIRSDKDFVRDSGDFERLRFLDKGDLLAMCWYNDTDSYYGKNLQVMLTVLKKSRFNFLLNEVIVTSSKQGKLEVVSTSADQIDFRKDMNHLTRTEAMEAVRGDTLFVTLGGKTYRFESRLRERK